MMDGAKYWGSASKIGPREINEDAHVVRDYSFRRVKKFMCLVAVADGMGGHNAGDLASSIAIEMLETNIHPARFVDAFEFHNRIENVLRELFTNINDKINTLGNESAEKRGMGTTLTCGVVGAGLVYVAHVGDSRAYVLSGNNIVRLTEDHSAVMELVRKEVITEEEALKHRERNVLTRAVGRYPQVEVDLITHKLTDNDVLFLCTDGLYSFVKPQEIISVISNSTDLEVACEKLADISLSRGCKDNVTALAWRYEASRDVVLRALKKLVRGKN